MSHHLILETGKQRKGIDRKPFDKDSSRSKGVEVCFAHISAKKGIKTFCKRAVAAMLKVFQQLDNIIVFEM